MSVHLKEPTTFPSHYRPVLANKHLLLFAPWVDGIISRIMIVLDWNWLWGCDWVCSKIHGSQAFYQDLGWVCIVPDPWGDETASSILFSKVVLEQVSTSRFTFGSSERGISMALWQVQLSPGPWEDHCLITGWVLGGQDWLWITPETQSTGLFQVSQLKLRSAPSSGDINRCVSYQVPE